MVSFTLFDAETTNVTATHDGGRTTGSKSFTVAAGPIARIGPTLVTQDATPPPVACTGNVGSLACTSAEESDASGNVYDESLQIDDAHGNIAVNTSGSPLLIDVSYSGDGIATPSGSAVLSVLNNQSVATTPITLTRDLGTGQSVTMIATLEGASPSQTVTITLSS